jgi:hypothetical protein
LASGSVTSRLSAVRTSSESRPVELVEVGAQRLVAGVELLAARRDVRVVLRIVHLGAAVELELAAAQAQALQIVVDGADLVLLDVADLRAQAVGARLAHLVLGESRLAAGDLLVALLHRQHEAVEIAPLDALEGSRVLRLAAIGEPVGQHVAEVRAVQVAVAELEQQALVDRLAIADVNAGALQARGGDLLGVADLGEHRHRRLSGLAVLRLHQHRRPEVRQAARRGQRQQRQRDDEGDRDRRRGEPDPGLARAHVDAHAARVARHQVHGSRSLFHGSRARCSACAAGGGPLRRWY